MSRAALVAWSDPAVAEIYFLIHTPYEHHETVVADVVTPLAREIRDAPELESLFFVRLSSPSWQVRFRVVGREGWLRNVYRPAALERLQPLREGGRVTEVEETEYQREVERYGGPEGMALAESIYTVDTLACLDLLELEREGKLGRSRRELALLLGERCADLLELSGDRRERFYRFAWDWAREMGTWDKDDLARLEERYQTQAAAFRELLEGETSRNPEALWGGPEAAGVIDDFLDRVRPRFERVLAGRAEGVIRQHVPYLGWSYTHLLCNRLGLAPTPEAIVRYLMHRHHRGSLPPFFEESPASA